MTRYADINLPAIFTERFNQLRPFDKDLITALNKWQMILKAVLDGGLSFDDNADIWRGSIVSHGTPGTEFSLAHVLGKTPIGYFVTGKSAAGSLFDGVTANTSTTIYFKSDAASVTFRVMLF